MFLIYLYVPRVNRISVSLCAIGDYRAILSSLLYLIKVAYYTSYSTNRLFWYLSPMTWVIMERNVVDCSAKFVWWKLKINFSYPLIVTCNSITILYIILTFYLFFHFCLPSLESFVCYCMYFDILYSIFKISVTMAFLFSMLY